MNKFKKACEELSSYLNRDSKGIELLARVTRTGNELRTELASAIDAKVRAESICQQQMEAAATAKLDASKAKAERQQQADIISALRCKVASYEKNAAEEQDQQSKKFEITPREVSRLIRDAMNDRQHLIPEGIVEDGITPRDVCNMLDGDKSKRCAIQLQDCVSNLSYGELAKLGRVVAIHAIMTGIVSVASRKFGDIYDVNKPESEAVDLVGRLFMRFMKQKCDFSEDYRHRSIVAGSKAETIKGMKGWVRHDE